MNRHHVIRPATAGVGLVVFALSMARPVSGQIPIGEYTNFSLGGPPSMSVVVKATGVGDRVVTSEVSGIGKYELNLAPGEWTVVALGDGVESKKYHISLSPSGLRSPELNGEIPLDR